MDPGSDNGLPVVLRRWEYRWTPLEKGYTDKILYVNVGTNEIRDKDATTDEGEIYRR